MREKIKAISLLPPDGVKLQAYYIYQLATKLELHRNTLSKILQSEKLAIQLLEYGYIKGQKKLTKKMVELILFYLGEPFY